MIRAAINHACNKRSFADQTEGVHVTTAVAVQIPYQAKNYSTIKAR